MTVLAPFVGRREVFEGLPDPLDGNRIRKIRSLLPSGQVPHLAEPASLVVGLSRQDLVEVGGPMLIVRVHGCVPSL